MEMCNPPHPGEVLKELYIEPLNLTVTQVAKGLGITRQALSELVNGKAGISTQMALKLAKAFNTTADLWLGMQLEYELWQAKQKTNTDNVQIMYI